MKKVVSKIFKNQTGLKFKHYFYLLILAVLNDNLFKSACIFFYKQAFINFIGMCNNFIIVDFKYLSAGLKPPSKMKLLISNV